MTAAAPANVWFGVSVEDQRPATEPAAAAPANGNGPAYDFDGSEPAPQVHQGLAGAPATSGGAEAQS